MSYYFVKGLKRTFVKHAYLKLARILREGSFVQIFHFLKLKTKLIFLSIEGVFSLLELRRLFTNKIGLQHLVTRGRGDLPIEPSTGLIFQVLI